MALTCVALRKFRVLSNNDGNESPVWSDFTPERSVSPVGETVAPGKSPSSEAPLGCFDLVVTCSALFILKVGKAGARLYLVRACPTTNGIPHGSLKRSRPPPLSNPIKPKRQANRFECQAFKRNAFDCSIANPHIPCCDQPLKQRSSKGLETCGLTGTSLE